MKYLILLTLMLGFYNLNSQVEFTVSTLPAMPEPVANNAVVSAYCGDTLCVYSFCGIDETKEPSGIHLKAWRYNTVTEEWSQLPDVPDDSERGKIAAGASVVNNKIYLIGGYYVADNFSEESSDDVHIFDPETNQWEADGAIIPVPIDDHIQVVWNEELIYVVTGWSDFNNVPDVQIYNPALDEWLVGTSVPNNSDYKVFGGSGDIIGNQIFYHGGVRSSFGFFPTEEVRKGTINPNDPTDITWEVLGDSELGTMYRAASVAIPSANAVYWIGGSELGYNFDGIDYNGTGGVSPLNEIRAHNLYTTDLVESVTVNYTDEGTLPMDLRGIARLTTTSEEQSTFPHSSIVCGGMLENQEVTDQVLLISSDNATSLETLGSNFSAVQWSITPQNQLWIKFPQECYELQLLNSLGQSVLSQEVQGSEAKIDLTRLSEGVYIVKAKSEKGIQTFKFKY